MVLLAKPLKQLRSDFEFDGDYNVNVVVGCVQKPKCTYSIFVCVENDKGRKKVIFG